MTELYETLDETERRIHKELVVMKQKKRDKGAKKTVEIDDRYKRGRISCRRDPFDCTISTEFEDIVEIKNFYLTIQALG